MRYWEIVVEADAGDRQIDAMKSAASRQQQAATRAKTQADIAGLRSKLAKKHQALVGGVSQATAARREGQ